MNGKVARALRHLKTGKMTMKDVGIISRRMSAESALFGKGPKPLVVRKRLHAGGHQATWPHTKNQAAQGRPVIVIRPVRALAKEMHPRRHLSIDQAATLRSAMRAHLPKHRLDRMTA